MTAFICDDPYQLLQACVFVLDKDCWEHCIFYTGDQFYQSTDDITIRYIDKSILTKDDISILTGEKDFDEIIFHRLMLNEDTEWHVFNYAELLYWKGIDNLILHEKGESTYIRTESGLLSNEDPDSVYRVYLQNIEDAPSQSHKYISWDFLDKLDKYREDILPIFIKEVKDVPDNCVLFIHNEPDRKRYTTAQINSIHSWLDDLLDKLLEKGYTVWMKDHHKRAGRFVPSADVTVLSGDFPAELIIDPDAFKYIISIRSNCLRKFENKYTNCFNAITKDAIMKCSKNWNYVYNRGIDKLSNFIGNIPSVLKS